jgi:hypothetical protein
MYAMRIVWIFALLVIGTWFAPAADAKIMGVFQGKIVKAQVSGGKRFVFVQGRSGFVRKVDYARAQVEYDDDFPIAARLKNPMQAVKVSANVRVTAEQRKGNWRANEILILAPGSAETGRPAIEARLKN